MPGVHVTSRIFVAAVCALVVASAWAGDYLTFRSSDDGAPFSLELRETRRDGPVSWVNVPGFHTRTAAGSRWLMCKYNELAKRCGFEYWTVIYPAEPKETFAIALHHSPHDDIAKLLGSEYVADKAFPPKGKSMSVAGWEEALCGRT
jgi:hypothetical protein